MLVLLSIATLYAGWRAARAIAEQLRRLPRTNDDFIFY